MVQGLVKKTTKKVIIGSIIGVCLTVIVIGLGIIIGGVTKLTGQVNDYSATVQKFDSSPKEFSAGEVAEFGPYDISVVSVEKSYVPSSSPESRAFRANESALYTLVTLNVKYNQARANYDDLYFSTGSWLKELGTMRLSDRAPLVTTPDPSEYPQEKQMKEAAKQDAGLNMTMSYRLPSSTTELKLTNDITLFTRVSALVGTEGMPRESYQYTIVVRTH